MLDPIWKCLPRESLLKSRSAAGTRAEIGKKSEFGNEIAEASAGCQAYSNPSLQEQPSPRSPSGQGTSCSERVLKTCVFGWGIADVGDFGFGDFEPVLFTRAHNLRNPEQPFSGGLPASHQSFYFPAFLVLFSGRR